ncbi:ArsC/Spx/MgsR family protein [Tistrella mobilis]|uniref:ArsC/Spx/MgsR family protein n=1 Tax=Tistrella mobilis TaxID=171437 RepID=UPI0035592430
MLPTLNGIKTCDTCRKAAKALEAAGRAHRVRDLRDDALKAEEAGAWLDQIGAERLVNRRSTTWRNLGDADRAVVEAAIAGNGDRAALAALLAREPTLVKRPVFTDEDGRIIALGFDAPAKAALGI